MKLHIGWISAMVLMVLGLLCGCETADIEKLFNGDVPKEAKFVISFHDVVKYPRGNASVEQVLALPDNKTVIINTIPFMSSRHIIEIAAQPVPGREGFYRLFLKPDQHGRTMWIQLSAQFRHRPAVILIDGNYYADFVPTKVGDGSESWIELPVDFDAVMAKYLVKYANDNYRFFNNGAKDDQTPFARKE